MSRPPWVDYATVCIDQMPLSSLLLQPEHSNPTQCITDTKLDARMLDRELANYLMMFYNSNPITPEYQTSRITNAWLSAVFIASEAWLTLESSSGTRYVYSDTGIDTVIPTISLSGMIIISTLWVVYTSCLFSVAVYSAKTPRWTNQLDAFAMMRVGAATNEHMDLNVGFETDAIDMLDEMPGFVGDGTSGEGDVGALRMGACMPLNGSRRYKCYRGDELKVLRKAKRRAMRRAP